MFGLRLPFKKDRVEINALRDELRKSRQEREAARLGLANAVQRLLQQARDFPLDKQVEMVANDLAAAGKERSDDPS